MSHSMQRRAFLTMRSAKNAAIRPPWSLSENAFISACTRCNLCIEACPENILQQGGGGFPEVNFANGECTFCAECVTACPDNALQKVGPPWQIKAEINASCLTRQDIVCMSCAESCEHQAIHFIRNDKRVPQAIIDNELCTGCGACYQPCPTQAISLCQKQI